MMLGRLAAHLTPSTADDMFTASATAAAAPPTRPHILLAVADDLGWNDVGSFNPGPRTPAAPTLDGLMAQGVKLKQHYSVSPPQHSPPTSQARPTNNLTRCAQEAICSPTRGALMSGRYPHRWGGQSAVAIQNTENYFPTDEVTLATRLREAGYATHLAGKWRKRPNHTARLRPYACGFFAPRSLHAQKSEGVRGFAVSDYGKKESRVRSDF